MSHPGLSAARANDLAHPSAEALRAAENAAKRAHRRATPVRYWFIERAQADDPPPPLARILRGGRGGEVRLKLLLALLWLGAGGQHDVNDAPYSFAALLGLPEQFGKGARRVNDALNWLRDHAFITLERTPGKEPKVTLLSELGDGRPYVVPGRAAKNRKTGKATPDNLYIQLPVGFWTDGLAATLSGRATAMLLVLLLLERSPGDKFGDLWASPGEALRRFDLSEDTRYRGFRELAQHGLVMVDRQPVRGDLEARRARRVRNVYTLLLPRSNQIPAT